MNRALFASLIWLIWLALAPACNAPATNEVPNNSGFEIPDGKHDTINPTGSDHLGKLTITSPPATDDMTPIEPAAYYVEPSVVYAKPDGQRLVEGEVYVGLYLHNGPTYDGTEVTIRKDQTTELRLAGLHLDNFTDYPTTVGTSPIWMTSRISLQGDIGYAGLPNRFLQLIAAPFSLTLQADTQIARLDVSPVAGEVTRVDATLPDPRMVIFVGRPDRTLPDAKSARFLKAMALPADQLISVYGDGSILRSESVALVDNAEHLALGNDKTKQHYNLYLNGTWTEVKANAGGYVDLPVRRLDVGDVAVTDEDGKTTTVHGAYSVEWAHATSATGKLWMPAEEAQNLPTGTGVDVVPGTYRVTVTYPRHEQPSPGKSVYNLEIE